MNEVTAAVIAAPYRTSGNYLRYKPILAKASYIMLASALVQASSQPTTSGMPVGASGLTIPRIFALQAILNGDGAGNEACSLFKALAKDADLSEIALAPDTFEELLRSFADLQDSGLNTVRPILHDLARRMANTKPGLSLTQCLSVSCSAEHWPLRDARSLESLDLDLLNTELNLSYGPVTARDAALFFAHKATALIELRGDFATAFVFAAAAVAAQIHARVSLEYVVELFAISELLSTGQLTALARDLLPKSQARAALADISRSLKPLEQAFKNTDCAELENEISKARNLLGPISTDAVKLAWTTHRLKSVFTTLTRANICDIKLDQHLVTRAVNSCALGCFSISIDDAGIITRHEPNSVYSKLWISRGDQLSLAASRVKNDDTRIAELGLTPAHSHSASVMESD